MTEGIWIAVIGGAQAIMLGLIGMIAKDSSRNRKDSARVREQVENSHVDENGDPYNLRDNIDENHAEVLNAIGRVERDLTGVKKDVGRLDDRDVDHGKHHQRVDGKLESIRDDLSEHLEWSRVYVAENERKQS